MNQWSNQACFGYMILAAKKAGLNDEQLQQIVRKMHTVHDEVTVEEAAKFYRDSDY